MSKHHPGAGPTRAIPRLAVIAGAITASGLLQAGNWLALKDDGVHDPHNPGLKVLQAPQEALSQLPPDSAGNKVDWIAAMNSGYITPRSALVGDRPVRILDTDIIMDRTGSLPGVRFPHKPHTQWLDCGNCHEKPFASKLGATPISMNAILQGEYCGICHGAVAFPLTECDRCHSVPRGPAQGKRP